MNFIDLKYPHKTRIRNVDDGWDQFFIRANGVAFQMSVFMKAAWREV
jgi:hypothetical protein